MSTTTSTIENRLPYTILDSGTECRGSKVRMARCGVSMVFLDYGLRFAECFGCSSGAHGACRASPPQETPRTRLAAADASLISCFCSSVSLTSRGSALSSILGAPEGKRCARSAEPASQVRVADEGAQLQGSDSARTSTEDLHVCFPVSVRGASSATQKV